MKTLLFAALLLVLPLTAQNAPYHVPDGGARERMQSVLILPKPGASFSATVVTEWTRLLQDGTTTTVKNHRIVARDSGGRIFEERRFFSPTGDKDETMLSAIQVTNPQFHEYYNCTPARRICTVSRFDRPITLPIVPTGNLASGDGTVTREELGHKSIDDLDVDGSREITTIKAGVRGYQQPEPTIKEFWYSPRLDLNVITRRFEPRGGAQSITLTNINLSEPNPELFKPPAGYKIIHTDDVQ